ncbi:MAG TPA: class II fructose-bisphosphate aldolase [Baekduia sp.]|uniref:class II fructose-bisphosphate aldolase n=1 Tax=Baekduia sp. TaxID=2600305 RepID=UPI002D79027D|nr:class II fructose-bisphosphate aldolase [Baekduia sp.]HET6507830.1 class II fructose-bisphosphate aldolase [Baekduia sp.]
MEALRQARRERRALVGFSIYNLEQGLGVIRAAEAVGAPVLLQAGSSAFRYAGREPLAGLALGLAATAAVPAGVHLDHATDLGEIEACLRLGYTSVMFDGSARSLERNIEATREVVRRAHAAGAWVEAELAGIAGDEDESSGRQATATTDPGAAARFVAETGVDALAVAIGNVHGIGDEPVRLDLDLLARIGRAVEIPLVLHGASGLPPAEVSAAIALGVAKLNVNTELRHALREAVLARAADPPAGDGVAALLDPVIGATRSAAEAKIRAFSSPSASTTGSSS